LPQKNLKSETVTQWQIHVCLWPLKIQMVSALWWCKVVHCTNPQMQNIPFIFQPMNLTISISNWSRTHVGFVIGLWISTKSSSCSIGQCTQVTLWWHLWHNDVAFNYLKFLWQIEEDYWHVR
jgi:hypothetical protein